MQHRVFKKGVVLLAPFFRKFISPRQPLACFWRWRFCAPSYEI